MIEKALEQFHSQPGIQAARSGSYAMHTQLRESSIDSPDTCHGRQHRSHGTPTPTIVPDLEDL